jgi:hypothetical protein
LFSLASAAAVTWAIMKPEFTPPLATRNGGNCDMCLSIISEMRRSLSEPISAMASAMLSAAMATGSAWKLPPEITSPSAANTSGLSDTALDSIGQHFGSLTQLGQAGAHDLWLAAQGVGVLNLVAVACDSETWLPSPNRSR